MSLFQHARYQRRSFWGVLIFTLCWNELVYSASRLFTSGLYHHDLELPVDRLVPFIPWTVSIYLICFLFWAINYYLVSMRSDPQIWQFFSAEFLAKCGCLLFFVVLPTTNIRPATDPSHFWGWVMTMLYQVDAADNLFPSIHCLVSWFSFIAVRRNEKIPLWYRIFSFVFALLVCVSTLTTKQHVFVDTIAGILLAEGCWHLTGLIRFDRLYKRIFTKFDKQN